MNLDIFVNYIYDNDNDNGNGKIIILKDDIELIKIQIYLELNKRAKYKKIFLIWTDYLTLHLVIVCEQSYNLIFSIYFFS